ncbi:MAG: DUF1298 domain-containing protein, partial [Myxococcales bacterium]|nr:DUF1298 domain-containing protein [Myxococcales bacterium]
LSARAIARVCGTASLLAPTSARPPAHRVHIGNLVRTLRLAHDPRGLSVEASLRAVASERARLLAEPSPVASWLRRAVLRMPQPVIDRVFATMPPFFSNFRRWSGERLELGGQTLRRLHAIPPLLPYHGATMTYVSYAGELHCDLTTDPTIRSDAAGLKEAIEASDAELCEFAAGLRHDDARSGAAPRGG